MSAASDPAGHNDDRPVLLLGARSDIARSLAGAFAARGHPIQLAGRDMDALARDAGDLALRHRVPVTTHQFDATALETFETFFDALPAVPRVVISAVGLMGNQAADAADPARVALIVASNMTGPACMLEIAARRLDALDAPAAIIGISSVAGDRGRARNYVYGSSKAGFTAYLSGLRQKYAARPLSIMTVRPGFVATSMTEGMDLPPALTATPEGLAKRILGSLDRNRPVHIDLVWRLVMAIITHLPERIFMRLRF